jgi:uracil-DNA glycosylase
LHLDGEWRQLPRVRVVVCLGRVAYDVCWQILEARGNSVSRPRPPFLHGQVAQVRGGPSLIASYHPSRQNTHTGRLTQEMLVAVFARARKLIEQ